ncbi:hypothetical protein [Brucella tritici]|uniref:hypothetical protein n=1 Tax=Brucella tritici TaxID=94626 RepID=UPI002000F36F|nr:hypothetical protein [Brucella tritici]
MRKARPLTPAEEKAQAEYEAWHEARMQDLAAEEQERQEALRKGVMASNTENEFRYEWLKNDQHCFVAASIYESRLRLSDAEGWEPGADITGEPARLLTAWLIERGYGPKGSVA